MATNIVTNRRGTFAAGAALRGVTLLLALTTGCSPHSGNVESGPGGRRQSLALSPRQELAAGRHAYDQVMTEYRGRLLPVSDPAVQRVRHVTDRLAGAARIEPLQREINLHVRGYVFEWEANVLKDGQVNAFCLPAGKIFVLSGLLGVTGDNDDYLATVLSHEMAHALAHHASERVAREQSGAGVLRSLSYDRMQESEADHIGVFLMALAGFDPERAVDFWQHMSRAGGGRGLPEFLSDHPSSDTRVHDLRQWAPKARAAKRAFDEGRIAPPR